MKSYRVLLVEAHALFRQGLTRLLSEVEDIEVVGQACAVAEALCQVRVDPPDVVVVDADLLTGDGTNFTHSLRSEAPNVKIVVLTASDQARDARAVTNIHANGYVAKSAPAKALIESIKGAMRADLALGQGVMQNESIFSAEERTTEPRLLRPSALSERERQVLRMVAAGAANQEIARALNISTSTVRSHLHRVHDKLGLETRVQVALYALQHGIYP